MAAIYANASVTILALQGRHANHGLRGFRDFSEPRNLCQSVHLLDTGVKGIVDPMAKSRGWIYQEEVFSRRKLVFDGDSVRWECSAATWQEHVEISSRQKPRQTTSLGCQSMIKPSIPGLIDLQSILHDFINRNFSNPEDVLNAFAGVSFVMNPALAGVLISGLPTAFFDIALLWQPQGRVFRRTAKGPAKPHCLPSWSWAGWSGMIDFDTASASNFIRDSPDAVKFSRKRRITRILSWRYHYTVDSPGIPICPNVLTCKNAWLENKINSDLSWTEHHISGISESSEERYEPPDPENPSRCYYSHSSYPGYEFWYPIPLWQQEDAVPSIIVPCISAKTRAVWLFPAEVLPKNNGYTPVVSLRDRRGKWVGVLIPHGDVDECAKRLKKSN
ncbi:hypothetical protein PV08_09713 [Exophiala spinifera]|uniref:Heterokaryon incompatibility domain-containing protein n=1 Tax=Exophiala spinifera TaxID=91928 RepID=A0A0D1YBY3_9EURO|nr:uncharacterized protein PV08_09713 [Exophiala spinifera]KIW12436.1 hypothetical protein PV08_09713 [Exophiala spinifera]